MAITKIHAIKSTLGKALAYIENPDKTDGQMLVSGYNCEPQTASIDFEMTAVLAHKARNLKRKRSSNLAYHLIQSFSPEDAVTPEQAHELGKKLAFEYTGGKYEYVVATHIDKGHIHNHIMLNAVSFYDYKKLRTVPYRTARQIRDISDRLCMEAHLSVIDDPQKIGQLYPENTGKKKSVSNRTEIRKRLNFCLELATDYSQFLSMAKELEITPTIRGKHMSYLLEGAGRAVRDNSLSDTDTFTYAGICARLSDNAQEQKYLRKTITGILSTATGMADFADKLKTAGIVALGIYLKLKLKKETPEWLEQSLPIIMNAAFEKGIVAHGTNGWLDVIDIMKMLILAGARKFIEQNAQSATNFTRQMKMVMSYYANTIAESDQNPDKWAIGTKAMQSVLAAWDGYTHTIFVYGTLMRGEKSHKILAKEMYGGTAILDGYEIYDCFQYPGVMEKENRKVFGEVYFVREQTLEMIDFYENEGVLFRRKKVMLSGKLKGDVYVYYDCDNPCDLVLNRLWSTDLKKRVWYAGYGSNLSSKRFECYIRGGLCAENMVTYKGCTDKSGWRSDYFETFPGNLYFGNRSHSWNNYGVAFFDPDIAHKDPVVMHLYNISYGQLLDCEC